MMAEVERKAAEENGQVKPVAPQVASVEGSASVVTCSDREGPENVIIGGCKKEGEIQPKEQELPELIRQKHESKGMMPCLPSINLFELNNILRDPNMPSQKILKEVADKMMSKSEESESDDGSVSSGGGVVGMKGLLDCIFEVSYMHEDSDNSDDDDGSFERIPRQIPCTFCNKVFGSTMTWNTHVLVAHPQQEHSVHNIRKTSLSESERKEKSHPHRKHPRTSSKSECDMRDIKAHYTSAAKTKQASELPHGEGNVPVRKRHSSLSKSQHREGSKSDHSQQPSSCLLKSESPSKKEESSSSMPPCDLVRTGEEIATAASQNGSVGSSVTGGVTCQVLGKTSTVEGESVECLSSRSSSQLQEVEVPCLNQPSSEVKDDTELLQCRGAAFDIPVPVDSSDHPVDLSTNSQCGRKRRTRPELPESTSVSALSPKRSRKNVSQD